MQSKVEQATQTNEYDDEIATKVELPEAPKLRQPTVRGVQMDLKELNKVKSTRPN